MHSSFLKSSDFDIVKENNKITLDQFCDSFGTDDNLAVISPNRVDGVEAALLILTYMTAFYNLKKIEGLGDGVYPNFYSFQHQSPPASYGMLDIWPDKKSTYIKPDPGVVSRHLIEKEISILILPDTYKIEIGKGEIKDNFIKSVKKVFMYSVSSEIENSNLTIESSVPEIHDWITTVFNTPSIVNEDIIVKMRDAWLSAHPRDGILCQSFKTSSIEKHLITTA